MPGYLQTRLAFLRSSQNKDGGWGYFPGKGSWLEPTAWALLACEGRVEWRAAFDRGWRLVRSWQRPDGAWRTGAHVPDAHWATALAVRLHCATGLWDEGFRNGVKWLLEITGAESGPVFRLAHLLRPRIVELDPSRKGWPWRPGSSSWIEPTAHTIMALKHAAPHYRNPDLHGRIAGGEQMLLDRRCRDGGWNYGNRRVLGADLPSHPESTALALLALKGPPALRLAGSLDLARRFMSQTKSPLALAWLNTCLSAYGDTMPLPCEPASAERPLGRGDVLLAAIEILASKQAAS